MTIHVTQEHIDKGALSNSCKCPVALALQEVLQKQVFVCQTVAATYRIEASDLSSIGQYDDYGLPQSVADFVRRFDAGQDVEPFTFELGARIL